MNRRELLRLGGGALLLSALPAGLRCASSTAESRRFIYVDPARVDRIRETARTPLLRPVYEAWAAEDPGEALRLMRKAAETGNLVYDLRDALQALSNSTVVQLVDPTPARQQAIVDALVALVDLPKWDYMLDGAEVIGVMRSSLANSVALFAREVLGPSLDADLEAALLDAVAEKGCLPCYRTIYGMEHPDEVAGWRMDDYHLELFPWDLSRWPVILGANNLRAVPTMGLGVGALALEGRDPRAGQWREAAEQSTRRFLGFFSPDGSYFEGVSYVDYALRTLLQFIDAHERLRGDVDWSEHVNLPGVVDFILALQAGRTPEGAPDVVNFSDARRSVYPCVPSWLARRTGSGEAQFAAENVSDPGFFLDFLWYDPARPAAQPADALKDVVLDLGWVVSRTGWAPDDAVLAFRSGGPANHEHADRNSFLFKRYGERLLTDHFGAAYDAREPGWLLRLTEAHNAVLIDGRGHQYHDGSEGTNESDAEAKLLLFETDGDRTWWSSDATQAYALVDPDVTRVRRTVLFAKPDVVVLLDEVQKARTPSAVAVRFFPDDTDGEARLETETGGFIVRRPRARLHATVRAVGDVRVETGRLDLPAEMDRYPFIEVTAGPARATTVATVLVARPAGDEEVPEVTVEPSGTAWVVRIGDVAARIETLGDVPDVTWS